MYIVTRRDLTRGLQCAQIAHCAMAWLEDHGIEDDTVIVLTVGTEGGLYGLLLDEIEAAGTQGVSWFREPDLQGSLTAIALPASAKKRLRKLPLAS